MGELRDRFWELELGALNRDCGTLDLYLPTEFSAN